MRLKGQWVAAPVLMPRGQPWIGPIQVLDPGDEAITRDLVIARLLYYLLLSRTVKIRLI